MKILGKGDTDGILDNASPELSRAVAHFLNTPQARTWTIEQRITFLRRVLKEENIADLSEEDQTLLTEPEEPQTKNVPDLREENGRAVPLQETQWTLPLENEEQLLSYLQQEHIPLADFLSSPLFLANEQSIPFLKTLWLAGIEKKEETPEQPLYSSIMLAFYLAPDTAQKLALDCEGACDPQTLHVTLLLLGDANDTPQALSAHLKEAVGAFARDAPPVHGIVSGIGCFTNTPTESGTVPFYASVDLPGVNTWREELRAALPVPIDMTHGFSPHCTLAYISRDAPFPAMTALAESLLFDTLWLCIGDDQTSYALQGREEKDALQEKTYGV